MPSLSNLKHISILSAFLLLSAGCAPDGPATLVVHNARIYTADAEQNQVSAMAIKGDEILATGSDSEMLALAAPEARKMDLQGKLVIPGIHDAHIHPLGIIRYDGCNMQAEPLDLKELSEFVAACIDRMETPAGEWLAVRQWNFEKTFPVGDLGNVRQALDSASTDHPIILLGHDGHHNATNSLGLSLAINDAGEMVGMNAKTLDTDFRQLRPYVGVDAQGEPNGAINEWVHLALQGAPNIMNADLSELVKRADQIPQRLNSLGITSIQEAAFAPELAALYDALLAQGEPSLRIRLAQLHLPAMFLKDDGSLDMPALLATASETREKYAQHPNISANALKLFVDGVLEGNPLANPPTLPNAAVLRDFHQPLFEIDAATGELVLEGYIEPDNIACVQWRENPTENSGDAASGFKQDHGFHPDQCSISRGVMNQPAEQTLAFVKAADEAGFAVHLHAIGDLSVRTAIDAIEAVTAPGTTTNRHSMTHLQLVSSEDIPRLGKLKIPLAFTYSWAARFRDYDLTVVPFLEKLDKLEDLYNEQSYYYQQFYPANSIHKAGGILAAGSDAPVNSDDPRPLLNIQAAVARDLGEGVYNESQRLDILDAIDAYTINGARLIGQQTLTGSLEAGKKADFAVLDRNIIDLARQGEEHQIGQTTVLQTWFDGELVYSATE